VLARVLFGLPAMVAWIIEETGDRLVCDEQPLSAPPAFSSSAQDSLFWIKRWEVHAKVPLSSREGKHLGALHLASPGTRTPAKVGSDPGRVTALAGVAADLLEARIRLRHANAALAEKELLAREADHRVANGLQLLHSALMLQAKEEANPSSCAALQAAARRVEAVAGAHRHLHTTPARLEGGEVPDARVYLATLLEDLGERSDTQRGAPDLTGRSLVLEAQPDAAVVSAGLLPRLGLITAELVANALKHGAGHVFVELQVAAAGHRSGVLLAVSDEGLGFPLGFDPQAAGRQGLGMRLVTALSRPGSVSLDPKNRRRIIVHLVDRADTVVVGTVAHG
jgi:two-component sensor histidine kinase